MRGVSAFGSAGIRFADPELIEVEKDVRLVVVDSEAIDRDNVVTSGRLCVDLIDHGKTIRVFF